MHKILSNPDWQRYILGKVCNIQIGGTPARNERRFWASNGNGHPWVAISDLGPKWITTTAESITDDGVQHSNVKPVPKGTLLMSFKLTIGRVGFAGTDLYTNEAIAAFSPKGKHIWLPWLYYALPSIIEDNIAAEQAIKGQTLNKRKLQNFVFRCPEYDEQRLIANVLDTLDTQIQQTEQLIAKLKQIKIGLLHDLLTKGIDDNGDVRAPVEHPEQFKEAVVGKIKIKLPKEWQIAKLGDIVTANGGVIQTGPFGSQLHAYEYVLEGVPLIMPQDIQNEKISRSQIAHITTTKAEKLARHRTEFNDVIFGRRGDLDRCAFIDTLEAGSICGTDCLLIRPPKKLINGQWLAAIYRHRYSQSQMRAKAIGSTMIGLNTNLLKNLIIVLPSLEEQTFIINKSATIAMRLHFEESYLAKLKQLKNGLMHDLLTGRVRVTQFIPESEQCNDRSRSVSGCEG